MFNLLISSDESSYDQGSYEIERGRFVTEYTADEITDRFHELSDDTILELKSFPCLFAIEGERRETRIGYITEFKRRQSTVFVRFEFDQSFPPLRKGALKEIRSEIDLGKWELSRTHWAIKEENIFEILIRRCLITEKQVQESHAKRNPGVSPITSTPPLGADTSRVFIVHGHDGFAKLDTSAFVKSLGLEPIILHEQASSGMTIIEKIEHYSNVGFGIVLYTECDIGHKRGALERSYRARQNVVFEHGYLIAKLGREKVSAVVKGNVETPNDISGVVYIAMDEANNWQAQLRTELQSAGYPV